MVHGSATVFSDILSPRRTPEILSATHPPPHAIGAAIIGSARDAPLPSSIPCAKSEPRRKSHRAGGNRSPILSLAHPPPLIHLSLHAGSPSSPPSPVLGPTQAAHASSRSPPVAPPHRTRPRRRPPRRWSRTPSTTTASSLATADPISPPHPLLPPPFPSG
jgi:hypothetical protein